MREAIEREGGLIYTSDFCQRRRPTATSIPDTQRIRNYCHFLLYFLGQGQRPGEAELTDEPLEDIGQVRAVPPNNTFFITACS